MEFKGTTENIGVANVPDRFGLNTTEGLYELYTCPFGMGIVGYAEKKEDALLFSKSYKMLEMLKRMLKNYDHGTQTYLDCQQLIKEATEL
jgi:hypothetical protein